MTGPEHYREAERLLNQAESQIPGNEPSQAAITARAEVHAMLALVGATINRYDPGWGTPDPLDEYGKPGD